jgi:hypothetical protein
VLAGSLGGLLTFASNLTLMAGGLLTILLARGQLVGPQRVWYLVAVSTWLFFKLGTSASAQVVTMLLTILIGIWIGGRGRVSMRWVLVAGLGVSFFLAMRGVANEHRRTMGRAAESLSLVTQSTLLMGLLGQSVQTYGLTGTVARGWEAASGRAALLDLFTDVMRQTPAQVPFWRGESYLSLVGAFVPRFLWPDKPMKTLGWEFGKRYGYLSPDDFSTTINFPFLIEFYANFGAFAVMAGMLLVGIIYRSIESFINVPGQSVLLSSAALVLLLPMISIESDFSLLFGGTLLYGGALWAVYRVVLLQTRRRRARAEPPARAVARTATRPMG